MWELSEVQLLGVRVTRHTIETASSSGASFFAWQRRARNEWLVMNRKGPWEGYRRQAKPVVSFPPSFARSFSSKERRLGTRQRWLKEKGDFSVFLALRARSHTLSNSLKNKKKKGKRPWVGCKWLGLETLFQCNVIHLQRRNNTYYSSVRQISCKWWLLVILVNTYNFSSGLTKKWWNSLWQPLSSLRALSYFSGVTGEKPVFTVLSFLSFFF